MTSTILLISWKKLMRIGSTEEYRRYHQQRQKQRLAIMEKKRQRILGHAATIADILKKNGATKGVLFGSTLNPKHFRSDSDLDLLVYNLPLSRWQTTLEEIEEIEGMKDIEIDLKRAEELPAYFLSFADKLGRRIL
jgi:predicted nucleotidyltransferase